MKFKPDHLILLCGCACLAVLVMSGLPALLWGALWPPPRVVEISRTERSGPFYAVILCERNALSFNLASLGDILVHDPAYTVVLELRTSDKPAGTYLRQVLGYGQDDYSSAKNDAPQARIDSENQRVILTYAGGEIRHVPIFSRDYFDPVTR